MRIADAFSLGGNPSVPRSSEHVPQVLMQMPMIAAISSNDRTNPLLTKWPAKFLRSLPLAETQSFIVASSLPDSTRMPSDEKTTERTPTEVTIQFLKEPTADHIPRLYRFVIAEGSVTPRHRACAIGGECSRPGITGCGARSDHSISI
jgi:hypothetical protein